jgi:hypothetical protein
MFNFAMGNPRRLSVSSRIDHVCDDLCSNLSFIGLTGYMGEILDRFPRSVPLGSSFTSDPLLLSSDGNLVDPYIDSWIWSRKKSFEMWLQCSLSSARRENKPENPPKKWTCKRST